MLIRKLVRIRKKIMFASATAILAGAFEAGGCTINVDESLLQSLGGLLESTGVTQMSNGAGVERREGHRFGTGNPPHRGGYEEADDGDVNE